MVRSNFKEKFSREASKKVIQVYKEKKYIQEKEIKMFKNGWKNNTNGIQDMFEKLYIGLFKQR